jgi:hypothetical protein
MVDETNPFISHRLVKARERETAMASRTVWATILLLTLEACASSQHTTSGVARTRRRRRPAVQTSAPSVSASTLQTQSVSDSSARVEVVPSRANTLQGDRGAMDAHPPPRSIGTPAIASEGSAGELHATWRVGEDRSFVRCEGTGPSVVPSTQSPYEPGNAAIVRAFLPIEHAVIACHPPTNERGRLSTRGLFVSNGAPQEFSFPGVTLSREQAQCVGEALCSARMPAFRSLNTTVDYEVLVYISSP